MTKHEKSDKFIKWVLIFALIYFLGHIAAAVAQTTIVTMPDCGQLVCINQGGFVTCY